MLKEFKEFAIKGNAVDLAVGVIIGAAFGKIIESIVTDLISPFLSLITGQVNLINKFWVLSGGDFETLAEAKAAGAITFNYGSFLNAVVSFILVAFVIFLIVRQMNRSRKAPAPSSKLCPYCKSQVVMDATKCPACTSNLANAR